MKRTDAAALLLLALCLYGLLARLATVPAMSLDEAWIAPFGQRLRNAGLYTPRTAFAGLKTVRAVEPSARLRPAYQEAYERWRAALRKILSD